MVASAVIRKADCCASNGKDAIIRIRKEVAGVVSAVGSGSTRFQTKERCRLDKLIYPTLISIRPEQKALLWLYRLNLYQPSVSVPFIMLMWPGKEQKNV